jgi:hypothetical protein
MSDRFDPELLEAARKIAARCGAIDHCPACDVTWTTAAYDPRSTTAMAALVAAAKRVVQEDEALDRFADDGGLQHALGAVLSEAAPKRGCSH